MPGANEAIVVLARPARWNPDGGTFRLVDEQRRVLVDLRVGEHAVVSLPAGEHRLFAFDWSSGVEHPWCAGAMRATLGAGRVYAVRVGQYPTRSFHLPWMPVMDLFDCHRVELYRVSSDERRAFWSEVRGTSRRRLPLGERRERSPILENPWRSEQAVVVGNARITKSGTDWSSAWSVLHRADGEPSVP